MAFSLLIISENYAKAQCCYQTEIESKLIPPDNLAWHIVFSRVYLTTDAGRMISIKSSPIKGKISGKSIVVSAVVVTNVNQVNELVLEDKNNFFLGGRSRQRKNIEGTLFCFVLRKVIYLDSFSSLA